MNDARPDTFLARRAHQLMPAWAHWGGRAELPWSLRLSEDVLIVDPDRGVLAAVGPEALRAAGPVLGRRIGRDFGGSVITLTTAAHESVAAAAAELGLLRGALASMLLDGYGLRVVSTGLHPWSECADPGTAGPVRARPATGLAGILGRLDPTCSLRIDVAVAEPEAATRALDGLRAQLPLLLALSANSPFWRGRYTGFASARTALRATLRHSGFPRRFGSYANYVAAVDALINAGAVAGPAAIEWDARLRPEEGVVEVAITDAQATVADVTGLAALAQCLVRLHAERDAEPGEVAIPELLVENRFAAAQKGIRAGLIDASGQFAHRATEELSILIESCAPIARELDCAREIASAARIATDPGFVRQRRVASFHGLAGVISDLSDAFVEPLLVGAGAPV
jgi:glutamate---cysteine ligase / carboxylate-amine ligase